MNFLKLPFLNRNKLWRNKLWLRTATVLAILGLPMVGATDSIAADKAYSTSAPQVANTKADGKPVDDTTLPDEMFPQAAVCGTCHTQIYKEWASSNHAFASISPMFHKFEQKINDLASGTIGSFCVRCHQQVGTQRGELRHEPLWNRSQVAREGVTCITCHRVNEEFTKVNGERRVIPGTIHAPVYGTLENSVFDNVLGRKDELRLATTEGERGRAIHGSVAKNSQMGKSEFCVSCHQVAVNLGIKLEVVWDQYRDSPAAAAGITCQECHMGKVPGRAEGYTKAPSAVIGGKPINPNRRHSNHAFYGPGYTASHPGIFPHNPRASRWKIQEWLEFDYRAGWGTEAFESAVESINTPLDDIAAAVGEVMKGKLPEAVDKLGSDDKAALAALKSALMGASDAAPKTGGSDNLLAPAPSGRDSLLAPPSGGDGLLTGAAPAPASSGPGAVEMAAGVADAVAALNKAKTASKAEPKAVDAARVLGAAADKWRGHIARLKSLYESAEKAGSVRTVASDIKREFDALKNAADGVTGAVKVSRIAFGLDFPDVWRAVDDRVDARSIITENIKASEEKRELRRQVMENGGHIDGPFFDSARSAGKDLDFHYVVTNTNLGHNLPSGSLGAQPELWLNVALVGPDGKNVWESGYVDSNGDMADLHSLDVAAGKIKHDDQLFNLQTKFLTTNVKGTDREMYLPVNVDIDQMPLIRPANVPTTVINHPPFIRMEGRSLPPGAHRKAKYSVPGRLLKQKGTYKLAVRMRSRAEPIYFMRFVDATRDMERSMNEWMIDLHAYTVKFEVK